MLNTIIITGCKEDISDKLLEFADKHNLHIVVCSEEKAVELESKLIITADFPGQLCVGLNPFEKPKEKLNYEQFIVESINIDDYHYIPNYPEPFDLPPKCIKPSKKYKPTKVPFHRR